MSPRVGNHEKGLPYLAFHHHFLKQIPTGDSNTSSPETTMEDFIAPISVVLRKEWGCSCLLTHLCVCPYYSLFLPILKLSLEQNRH